MTLISGSLTGAIGVPVAAGAVYPLWGIRLSPIIAAAAMGLSSLSVVTNSSRLRHWHTSGRRSSNGP